MVKFNRRTAPGSIGIGHHLKNARRALGLSIDEIAEATKIRRPLILAIEQSALHEITEPFYRTLILKTYSEYVGVNWEDIQAEYEREAAYIPSSSRANSSAQTSAIGRSELWVATRMIKNASLTLSIAGACVYLMFLAYTALQPPTLVVQGPTQNFETTSNTTIVRGVVSGESDVRINGQRVLKKGDGTFEENVTLSSGMNVIQIAAAKKYSKESVVTRTVVYHEQALP